MEIDAVNNNHNLANDESYATPDMDNNDWVQVLGTSKRKQSDITETTVDDTNYVMKTRLNKSGEESIKATQCLITPIKVNFSTRAKTK